ncbi:hypothetical protein HZA75_07320 [Candidatus Roizmanbacteria bacterium]|nr:hypothetical protein [Candidatus Roizmanbacteria bacterium]
MPLIIGMSFGKSAIDFCNLRKEYTDGIHLVYGETDKYVSQELRNQTIKKVQKKANQL